MTTLKTNKNSKKITNVSKNVKIENRRHLSLSQLVKSQLSINSLQKAKEIRNNLSTESTITVNVQGSFNIKIKVDKHTINYKNSALLQQYVGLGGKILPRRQTLLSAKQQRYVAKTIKTARIMGLLPFVRKEQTK